MSVIDSVVGASEVEVDKVEVDKVEDSSEVISSCSQPGNLTNHSILTIGNQ
jgi:hypothetical protein